MSCWGERRSGGGRAQSPALKGSSQLTVLSQLAVNEDLRTGNWELPAKRCKYIMLERVLQEIRARRRFVVTSHARPDGDGIGSALACGPILHMMGKDAEVVMHDGVPPIYQNLPFSDRVTRADTVPADFPGDGAIILLECDGIRRTLLDGLEKCFLINIDHHASGRNFAHINWIDSTVMATAELVYRLARLACVPGGSAHATPTLH